MGGEGGKEKLSRNSPLQGFCGVAGHRWLPSDFQLGTSGKFLLCLLVGAGQRLEEAPPPPEFQIHLSHGVLCRHFLSPCWVLGPIKDRGKRKTHPCFKNFTVL